MKLITDNCKNGPILTIALNREVIKTYKKFLAGVVRECEHHRIEVYKGFEISESNNLFQVVDGYHNATVMKLSGLTREQQAPYYKLAKEWIDIYTSSKKEEYLDFNSDEVQKLVPKVMEDYTKIYNSVYEPLISTLEMFILPQVKP